MNQGNGSHHNGTLAHLRQERDRALSNAMNRIDQATRCVKSFDEDVETFTVNHPVIALGGAVAIGAAAGLLIGTRPIRYLAKAVSLAVLQPLAQDLVQRFLRSS